MFRNLLQPRNIGSFHFDMRIETSCHGICNNTLFQFLKMLHFLLFLSYPFVNLSTLGIKERHDGVLLILWRIYSSNIIKTSIRQVLQTYSHTF